MTPDGKSRLTIAVCVAVIIASCAWIYFTQVKAAKYNVALHRRIGEVLAEQTANVVGKKGKVVTIAIDVKQWPELGTQLEAFKATLQRLGHYELREYEMDTKDQPKYGVGTGLSGRRYVRTVNKNTNANVFVSFVGAPKLTPEETVELEGKPKLIAESRSPNNLPQLFSNKLISVAVVSRFHFPAPLKGNPKTPEDWFAKQYQVLTAEGAGSIPKTE